MSPAFTLARRKLAERVIAIVPVVFMNGLFFGGLASISVGFWMIYHPLGPIAGGLSGIWVAFLISAESK